MKKTFKILLFISMIAIFTSCEDKKDVVVFGETEWYKSWLWKKYEPVIMERILKLDFNEDAKYWLRDKPLKFELRTINDEPVDNIKLYVNDKLCENNIFILSVDDKEAKIGIEFNDDAEEGSHSYIIKHIGVNNKSKLDDVSFESFGHNNSMTIKKTVVQNPTKVWTLSLLIAMFVFAILWWIVSRFIIWRPTSFSKVYIDYNDGMGQKCVKMTGKYELMCTNNPKSKDSLFSEIFKGKRQYEVNSFWTHDIVINDGKRRKINLQGMKNYTLNGQNVRRETFDIINDNGTKVTIETT